MKNILIVIDMQNDFIKNEPFGNETARAIIPEIQKMIESKDYDDVFFTRDCHYTWQKSIEMKDYPPHCLTNTEGWEIIDELKPYADIAHTINKFSYGCNKWDSVLYHFMIENITLVGVSPLSKIFMNLSKAITQIQNLIKIISIFCMC